MLEEITASTWPEQPGRIRCNRYYTLSDKDTLLAAGKTEWAMIDTSNGKLCKVADAYPDGLVHCTDTVCQEPFARISEDFTDCEILGKYTVRSTDIDLGQHMNNAAYVRALFGAFSCKELEEMSVNEVDIAFRSPCYEGDRLTLYRRKTDTALEIGIFNADQKIAAVARIS